MNDKPPLLSRPRDDSLEAYKAWMGEMYKHLTGKDIQDDESLTEEEWIERWREFWKKRDTSKPKP